MLTDRCLLLLQNPGEGGLRIIPEQALAGMMAGALLFDLAIAGKIDNDAHDLVIMNRTPSGTPLLDFGLDQLPDDNQPIPLPEMVTMLAVQAARILAHGMARLHWLGLLRTNALTPDGREKIRSLQAELHALLDDPAVIPDPEEVMLLGLTEAGQLWPILFTADQLAAHRQRLQQLARLEFIQRALLTAVQAFSAAEISELAERLSVGRMVKPCATAAGGAGVIKSALEHVYSQAGILRGTLALSQVNQSGGYDCPGCAWSHPAHRRERFEFCENGAKSIASEATTRMADESLFASRSLEELIKAGDYELEQCGRLAQPLLRLPGATHFKPVDWDAAFALVANEMQQLASPDEAVFYVSGKSSNEAAFLMQLLARQFGTNNLPGSANLCHEASGLALTQTLGSGKSTVTNDDLEQADLILLFGHNPGSNHPRMLMNLQQAARNGARLVAINPLPEAGLLGFANPREAGGLLGRQTDFGTLHLPVRVNGDHALVKALILALLELEDQQPGQVLDTAFIKDKTSGFQQFRETARRENMAALAVACGIDEPRIRNLAGLFARSKRVVAAWCLGVTQHANGVATLREIINLLLMRGMVGKPGTGFCPVRGHSNVQGHRTMGIGTRMPESFLDALGRVYDFQPPRTPGLDALATLDSMARDDVKVLFSLGGNLLSAAPDTAAAIQAFQRCNLVVNIATKLNRQHLLAGQTALILPCLGRTEKDQGPDGIRCTTAEDTTGTITVSRGCLEPLSPQMRSEPWIVAQLAQAILGSGSTTPWSQLADDYDLIRSGISRVVPGLEGLQEAVQKNDSCKLPNPARQGLFRTPDGRAQFTTQRLSCITPRAGQFLLTTLRSHDQFNSSIFGLHDRYRGIHGTRRIVMMHPEDIREQGFVTHQVVELRSAAQESPPETRRFRVHPCSIPRGCVAAYFPEANILIPLNQRDPESRTPAFKSTLVTITVAGAGPEAQDQTDASPRTGNR